MAGSAFAIMRAALAEAKKANIGVVIMKSVAPLSDPKARAQMTPGMSPYAAAIKWVINDKNGRWWMK